MLHYEMVYIFSFSLSKEWVKPYTQSRRQKIQDEVEVIRLSTTEAIVASTFNLFMELSIFEVTLQVFRSTVDFIGNTYWSTLILKTVSSTSNYNKNVNIT